MASSFTVARPMRTFANLLFCTLLVLSWLVHSCAAQETTAQEIRVAAAADLRPALEEIVVRFQAQSGAHVTVSYGSSGNFYQQLQSGAPFDLFFSANLDYPKKLEASGLTVPGSYYEYARGKIALLVQSSSSLDIKQGLKILLDPSVRKIAIADPSHAPYGQAAVAALKTEN